MIPPRWVFRVFWAGHGLIDRVSGGRLSTHPPRGDDLGVLYLVTRGRRSGELRKNGLNYLETGANLVVVGSNGGADVHPAWWLNLQAEPEAEVQIRGGRRRVRARAADAVEAESAWRRFTAAQSQYADYRAATSRTIPVVILEPA